MTALTRALKDTLRSLGLDRFIPPQAIAWYSLRIAEKTASERGVKLGRTGDKLILQKGDRRLIISDRHSIYARDLVLDFDVVFESVESSKTPEGDVVDFSSPQWHRLSGSGKKMFLTAFTEGEYLNLLYYKYGPIGPGDVVLDLGANCGLASLSFAEAVGSTGQVVALEPDPANFEALTKNLEYHHIQNVQPLCAGAWSHSGQLSFNSDGSMGATAASKVPRGKIITIPVISLLDLAEKFKLPKVTFIKMDIEGAEFEVILSSADFLERFRATWVIEVHERHRIGLLTAAFQAKNYYPQVIDQSESHDHPLLVVFPEPRAAS